MKAQGGNKGRGDLIQLKFLEQLKGKSHKGLFLKSLKGKLMVKRAKIDPSPSSLVLKKTLKRNESLQEEINLLKTIYVLNQ